MTRFASDAVAKLARRIFKDPTSATVADVEKLCRAVLLLTDGTLPK